MILNNLQKQKNNPKIQRHRKGLQKNLYTCTDICKVQQYMYICKVQQYMYTEESIRQSSEKCVISKAMDGIKDNFFPMDSFDSSDNNFKDFSVKKVQESFRKYMRGHFSYF